MSAGNQTGGFFLLAIFLMFLQMGIFAFSVTLFVIHRKRVKELYKTGLLLGIITFLLSIPLNLLVLFAADFSSIMPASLGKSFGDFVTILFQVVSIVSYIGAIGMLMIQYVIAAAEWEQLHPRPFPVLMRTGEKAWARIGIAAAIGALAALLSMVAGKLLHVGPGDLFKYSEDLLVNFNRLPDPLQFVVMLCFVIAAAVGEEILYRGALLGFFFRVSKNRTAWLLASIFAVSLLWALMHLPNTDNPTFKLAQVFILGVVFAEFARRWSLESAMAAHISLNVTALALGLLPVFQA